MTTIYILLSSTGEILWDNPIPPCIFDYISGVGVGVGVDVKTVKKMSRHDPILIESFRHTYGQYLESCPYAYLAEIPRYCLDVYDIIRIPCYASSFYPERIAIDIERCLELYPCIKDELAQITFSQYGVKLKDSVKYTYVQQRFSILKNTY